MDNITGTLLMVLLILALLCFSSPHGESNIGNRYQTEIAYDEDLNFFVSLFVIAVIIFVILVIISSLEPESIESASINVNHHAVCRT